MNREPDPYKPDTQRRWVLIETGGNQRYIFGSNRLRHIVGASQLVHEVGTTWVPEAVKELGLPEGTVVMTASGKALLLVNSAEAGRAVIRAVTRRALRDAPGLQVTGVVGPAFDPTDNAAHEPARRETYDRHAQVRAARPDPLVRDRVFPWHRLCRHSGQPVARFERYGDEEPVPASAGVLARSAARDRAKKRLVMELGDAVLPNSLDELQDSGWMAVVHADGNGVGGLFRQFVEYVAAAEGHGDVGSVSLQTHERYQREVACELNQATWDAVRDAVAELLRDSPAGDLRGRLLPIVVGGDDVTLACDAALAVPFVRAFADAFTRHTAAQPTLSAIAQAATGHRGLTASAGIAVVKSHHPFGRAYDLADALAVSAKRFKDGTRTLAAFDIHLAHTSTLRELAELREYLPHDGATPIARHAGPYLLGPAADLPDELRHRSFELFSEVSRWLDPDGWLSAAQAHALREAADRSLPEYEHQLDLVVGRAKDPARAKELLRVQGDRAAPADPPAIDSGLAAAPEPFLRLFDALHLRGLRRELPDPSTSYAAATLDGGAE